MFEVNVKNVMEERRGGGGDQLGFGVLMYITLVGLPCPVYSVHIYPVAPLRSSLDPMVHL